MFVFETWKKKHVYMKINRKLIFKYLNMHGTVTVTDANESINDTFIQEQSQELNRTISMLCIHIHADILKIARTN